MTKKAVFLIFIVILPGALTFAQTVFEEISSSSFREYRFSIKGESKKTPATATLRLSEKQNMVYLYFEAAELKSGEYKIFKGESCAELSKLLRSKKPIKEEDELYSFETKYGNISGERNLTFKSFQELGDEKTAFALAKVERKNKFIVSCTFENTARNAKPKEDL